MGENGGAAGEEHGGDSGGAKQPRASRSNSCCLSDFSVRAVDSASEASRVDRTRGTAGTRGTAATFCTAGKPNIDKEGITGGKLDSTRIIKGESARAAGEEQREDSGGAEQPRASRSNSCCLSDFSVRAVDSASEASRADRTRGTAGTRGTTTTFGSAAKPGTERTNHGTVDLPGRNEFDAHDVGVSGDFGDARNTVEEVEPPGQIRFLSFATKMPALYGNRSRIFRLGERGSGLRARGTVQDFYTIREQCLEEGSLFEDPEFPAEDSSIFFSKSPNKPFEWRRPMEIVEDPQLFVEGASRFDVQQGELGDCWLLAAIANLTLSSNLFFQIVPDDQGFGDKYAGIFHFRFWQYGRWVDVVIDDRLPTCYGKLVYMHSSQHNEFWSALLEKAYAKLHGSYEALKGGTTCEAMEDFTGGVTEMYELSQAPPNLYKIMMKAYERCSLMGCSIEPDPNVLEAQTPEGLVKGHAYSITKVKMVDIQTPGRAGKIPLIRLRNPWGNEAEWNGPWSDKSPEWRFIPEGEKEQIGLTFDDDGEFWMSYKDFLTHFHRIEICNLSPDALVEDIMGADKRKWEMSMFEGEWVRGITAGGCRNFLETFWHNPQYRITLEDPDEDDEENKCTVIVALMQKNRRSQRRMGVEVLTIGFAMYHLPDPDNVPKPLPLDFFKYNQSVARSPSFINLREVSCRFKLPPGVYCIVPSTFDPNEQGEFILRVFSENQNNMEEHDEEVGIGEMDTTAPHDTIDGGGNRVISEPEPEEQKTDDKAKEFFLKIAGEDLEVDWKELQEILDYAMRNETKREGFSKDVCRSMVALMDIDRTGKLGYEEFKALWTDVRHWKSVFKMYDKDGSGYLSAFELRQALNSAGYRLNNHILNVLMHRYGSKEGTISFDDYMMCAVKLKAMIDMFKEKDPDNSNRAEFTMEEWVEKTLYA